MKIKLFVSHRVDIDSRVICNEIVTPVYCGAVYKKNRWQDGIIGDDTGDNISEKRMSFCELTVQYWAWKNVAADYYGLCHYRRYLSFGNNTGFRNEQNQIYLQILNDSAVQNYAFDNVELIQKFCNRFDAILPEPAEVKKITPLGKKSQNVLELWRAYEGIFFDKGMVAALLQSIKAVQPQYYDVAVEYLNSTKHRGYNCYLMRSNLFNKLCELQFSIMSDMERRIPKEILQKFPRTIGYMGEILFGVFQYALMQKKVAVTELPLVFFENANSNFSKIIKLRLIYKYYCKKFIIKYFPAWGIKVTKKIYHLFL